MLVSKKAVLQPEVNEDKDNKENNINTKTTTIAMSDSVSRISFLAGVRVAWVVKKRFLKRHIQMVWDGSARSPVYILPKKKGQGLQPVEDDQ